METPRREKNGAYRIVRPLGRGGMGEVFLAYDERLGRLVALKRIRRDFDEWLDLRERFRREARAVARLNHVNVVQIYDVLLDGDDEPDTIIMEYVEGRSVAELLRDGPLPPATAVDVAAQVARGLGAAHGAGLAHRDLKASNVIVNHLGQAKVLDFGLARPVKSGFETPLTEVGDVVGTIRSMSPEQLEGELVGPESDLFSLGVLLYEMLTGEPPFALATQPPTPLAAHRLALPDALSALVDALLAKDPKERPANAEGVAEALESLRLQPSRGGGFETPSPSPSELDNDPTGLRIPGGPAPPAGPSPAAGAWPMAGVAALVLAVAVAAVLFTGLRRGAEPLRVTVLRPQTDAAVADLAAVRVTSTLLRTLAGLEGIVALDPRQIGGGDGSPLDVGRAVAANEVLTASITACGSSDLVSLRRLRLADGGVRGAESFEVPSSPRQALVASNAVAAALRRLYAEHPPRPGVVDLEARGEDYVTFLRVLDHVDAGGPHSDANLGALEELAATSPSLLDAHLLAARIALGLFADTKDDGYLRRCRTALERARPLARGYPPLLAAWAELALAEGDLERGRELLAELEGVHPGDPHVDEQRARIAETEGRLDEAVRIRRAVLGRHPTFRDHAYLAHLEVQRGEVEAARRHLEAALELAPSNRWALAKLAQLELAYGDLGRAEEIYGELAGSRPHRSHFTNLGLARFLLGDSDGAVESYRRALDLDPGHVDVLLNLADAESARGRSAAAVELYSQALARLRDIEGSAGLEPKERTTKAQCLLHLGRRREAVALVLETLQGFPQDAQVLYEAAVVYALAGEEASALACARKALALGFHARWFRLPAFQSLRADPEWQQLLDDG